MKRDIFPHPEDQALETMKRTRAEHRRAPKRRKFADGSALVTSTAGQGARCTEEPDLVLRWQPVCNDAAEN